MDGILTFETMTAYGLGLLTAGLIALVLMPIVHVRAVRNTRRQLRADEEARVQQARDVAISHAERDIAAFRAARLAAQSSAPLEDIVHPSEPVRRNNVVRLAVVRAANAAAAGETKPDDKGAITDRAATEIRAAAQRIDGRVSHIRHYGLPVHERRTKHDRDSSHP